MANVNGARFHLLLGRGDYARCLDGDGDHAATLGDWWSAPSPPLPASPPSPTQPLPAWDTTAQELVLQPLAIELPATAGEAALLPDNRRAAAADRNGNVYRIADDRLTLRVWSAGSGAETVFWPAGPADCDDACAQARLDFESAVPASTPQPASYTALAVTSDDYLVVTWALAAQPGTAASQSQQGLMAFDLVAGGPPLQTTWPAALGIEPFALAARGDGGAWLLDRSNRRLWELDARLSLVGGVSAAATMPAASDGGFGPVQAGQPAGLPSQHAPQAWPAGLDLAAGPLPALDPIAVLADGACGVLVLDRAAGTVLQLRRSPGGWLAPRLAFLGALPAAPQDFVLSSAPRLGQVAATRLFVTTAVGNQAHAYAVDNSDGGFALQPQPELYPLRRHAGRALPVLPPSQSAYYDSGGGTLRWAPLVQQPRQRHAGEASFVTPVLDSHEPDTVWDRLVLDAVLPTDTEIQVEARCGDACTKPGTALAQVIGAWQPQPLPLLRSTGCELPWLKADAARATNPQAGAGSWELLLQQAQGRYLQLRLRLVSNSGVATPRLRALRAWYPRFSYVKRFLPAVYREDTTQGDFLERWLANLESTNTGIEDRIAQMQRLFDARTVPGDALPWLASWFDIALDPGWDERRHRLLVQHAMDFFRWRGTVHGLRLALALAFDPCFDAALFDGPRPDDDGAQRIRIVEACLQRVPPRPQWTLADGNAGLAQRWAVAQGRVTATPAEQLAPFPLLAPAGQDAAWASCMAAALGFVPAAGAAERTRWQAWLQTRHGQLAALNAAHGSAWPSFTAIALPADLPTSAAATADWLAFVARADSGLRLRQLWADFLARRWRRAARLRDAHRSHWPAFDNVPLPDVLPATAAAINDWLQFEGQVLAMHRSAHRFSVLLPVASVDADPAVLAQQLGLAQRIVALEKPAHTVFDVRFFWAFNRVGEARLGLDTQLGAGSRAAELVPAAVIGRAYLGASFVAGAARPAGTDRLALDC